MKCNNEKFLTFPTMIRLNDNRCWDSKCNICNEFTWFCQHKKIYICCECCSKKEFKIGGVTNAKRKTTKNSKSR